MPVVQQLQSTLWLGGLLLARDLRLQIWSHHGGRGGPLRLLDIRGLHSTPHQAL